MGPKFITSTIHERLQTQAWVWGNKAGLGRTAVRLWAGEAGGWVGLMALEGGLYEERKGRRSWNLAEFLQVSPLIPRTQR